MASRVNPGGGPWFAAPAAAPPATAPYNIAPSLSTYGEKAASSVSDSGAVHRGVLAAVRSNRPPHPHASSFVAAAAALVGGAGTDPTAVCGVLHVVAGVRLGSNEFVEGPVAGPAEGVRPIAPVSTASSVWTA